MVEDDPDNQVFYALMECLYDHHPIQVPIAGSRPPSPASARTRSMPATRPSTALAIWLLTAAGNVDPEEIVRIAREILPRDPGGRIERDYGGEEDGRAACPEKELTMAVSTPIIQLGFKADPAEPGAEWLRRSILGALLCEVLLGNSSPLYAGSMPRAHQQELCLRL